MRANSEHKEINSPFNPGYFNQRAQAISLRIHESRLRATLAVEEALMTLYRAIGDELLSAEVGADGGAVLLQLSSCLRQRHPLLGKSLTVEGLKAMRQLSCDWHSIDHPEFSSVAFDRTQESNKAF